MLPKITKFHINLVKHCHEKKLSELNHNLVVGQGYTIVFTYIGNYSPNMIYLLYYN